MPRRKKTETELWDFHLEFTDSTMVETQGDYKRIRKLIESEFPYPKTWNITTHLNLVSQFGEGRFILNLRHNRKIYIVDYSPSVGDIYYNPDIRCLTRWCKEYGWDFPEPSELLVKSNIEFWKKMWDMMLIDSEYLDGKYGIRKSLDVRQMEDTTGRMETEEDEDEE